MIKSLGRGGAETLLPETLRVHRRKQFDFAYGFFLDYKDQLAPALLEQNAPVICFRANSAGQILLRVPEVVRYVQNWGADLIHCHLPLAGVVGRLAGKAAGIPVIYTEHNTQERYHWLTRQANLRTMAMNRLVLAVSDDVEVSLRRHLKKQAPPIRPLLNGVNTRRFDPADYDRKVVRKELDLPVDAPVVGTVCVFRTQKRLDEWLRLARRIADRFTDAHFVLVGDGPEEDRVRQLATELGLNERLHLPGRLADVRPWLAAMDVYLMTSEFEGLPVALLEAMSMELPSAVTSAGGIPEAVRHGQEGFLTAVDDPNGLYPFVERLVESPEMRRKMGQRARRRVQKAFSIERMARELEGIYREVIAGKV